MDVARRIEFTGRAGFFHSDIVRKARRLIPREEDELASIPTIYRIILGISQQSIRVFLLNSRALQDQVVSAHIPGHKHRAMSLWKSPVIPERARLF